MWVNQVSMNISITFVAKFQARFCNVLEGNFPTRKHGKMILNPSCGHSPPIPDVLEHNLIESFVNEQHFIAARMEFLHKNTLREIACRFAEFSKIKYLSLR